MGGCLVGVWGDLVAKATKLEMNDEFGRWCGIQLRGREGGYLCCVSCYRAPGGYLPGSLVGRMRSRGLGAVVDIHKNFFKELGEVVTGASLAGGKVMLGGR
jgi:hypothetical protein